MLLPPPRCWSSNIVDAPYGFANCTKRIILRFKKELDLQRVMFLRNSENYWFEIYCNVDCRDQFTCRTAQSFRSVRVTKVCKLQTELTLRDPQHNVRIGAEMEPILTTCWNQRTQTNYMTSSRLQNSVFQLALPRPQADKREFWETARGRGAWIRAEPRPLP